MKYIRIKNNGLIEPAALTLVGASSKRNDSTKIGMFGSGNKYALAYFLRNGYEVRIFAGKEEIIIETKPETFREGTYNVIYVNGERSSITTEMGKDWKFWQAMREIYCNAIDEGGSAMDYVQNIEPEEGKTHIYIDMKKDVSEFVVNFDNYFATGKKVIFECAAGRILEKSGTTANIYRKGVRCFEANKSSVYDYDFNEITIDENRLIRYFWEPEEKIWSLIYQCTDKDVIKKVLNHCSDNNYLEGCLSDVSTLNSTVASNTFREAMKELRLAPTGTAGLLSTEEIETHVLIPTKVFRSVRELIPEENLGTKFRTTINGAMYREIENPTELQMETLRKAWNFFEETGYDMPHPVKVVKFDNPKILGAAMKPDILISDVCLEKGVNSVVNVMIEEHIHLKYDVKDETRGFQTAAISELVTYMKEKNAYLL